MPITIGDGLPVVSVTDDYEDANSLGPFQLLDTVQFEVLDNPVFAQFGAVSNAGTAIWDQSLEVPFEPGTYALKNIAGVRFRNANQGGIARVSSIGFLNDDARVISAVGKQFPNAYGPTLLPWQFVALDPVTGDYQFPGEINPNLPNGIAAQQLAEGYRGILIFIDQPSVECWLQIQPIFFDGESGIAAFGAIIYHYIPANLSGPFIFAFDIAANYVSVSVQTGIVGGANIGLGIHQTNLEPGTYLGGLQGNNAGSAILLFPNIAIGAGLSSLIDIPGFFGEADIALTNGSSSPFLFQLRQINLGGITLGIPWNDFVPAFTSPVYGILKDTIWLPPGRNQMQVTNRGATTVTPQWTLTGRYKGLPG